MNTYDDEVQDMENSYNTSSSKTSKNELLIFIPVAKTKKYGRNKSIQLPVKGRKIPTFCSRNMKVLTQ